MKLDRTGIILYTVKYEECIEFYANVLGLKVMFTSKNLTCFEFGSSYLMVELDDEYFKMLPSEGRLRTCLRMNVADVKKMANKIRDKGIEVDYQEKDWGTIAKFYDPDGNLCAFKDSEKFEQQVKEGLAE